jgi:hypothetical protein
MTIKKDFYTNPVYLSKGEMAKTKKPIKYI